MAAYREAEVLLSGAASSSPEARAALAACRSRMGGFLTSIGKNAEALAAYRMARSDQQELVAVPGASPLARRELGDTVNRIGRLLANTGRPREATDEYRTALAIRKQLADADPAVSEFRNDLAASHNNLGIVLWQTGRLKEAEAEYRTALAIREKLANDNPAVSEFGNNFQASYFNLANLLRQTGRLKEAEAEFRSALAICEKLADDNPAVPEFRSRLGDWPPTLSPSCCLLPASPRRRRPNTARLWQSSKSWPPKPRRRRISQPPGTHPQQAGRASTNTGKPAQGRDPSTTRGRPSSRCSPTNTPRIPGLHVELAFSLGEIGRHLARTGNHGRGDRVLPAGGSDRPEKFAEGRFLNSRQRGSPGGSPNLHRRPAASIEEARRNARWQRARTPWRWRENRHGASRVPFLPCKPWPRPICDSGKSSATWARPDRMPPTALRRACEQLRRDQGPGGTGIARFSGPAAHAGLTGLGNRPGSGVSSAEGVKPCREGDGRIVPGGLPLATAIPTHIGPNRPSTRSEIAPISRH